MITKQHKFIGIFFLIIISLITYSCKKEEGFGGNSSIKGKMIERVYNDDYSILLNERPAKDEDVFIVFGNDDVIGDDSNTSFDGSFSFEYLFEGSYSVFYYSEDTLSDSNEEMEEIITVDIDKNEEYDLGNIYKIISIDYDDGDAMISGNVFSVNYIDGSSYPVLIIDDTTYAQEYEVYLSYGDHPFYDERIRTQYDGSFTFTNLIKGSYKIFLYSENITGGNENDVLIYNTVISDDHDQIDLGDIYIHNL